MRSEYALSPWLARAGGARLHVFRFTWRRALIKTLIGLVIVVGLLFAALVGIIFIPTHVPATAPDTSPSPRVKHYYLALGDSLAFGFQVNFNWDQGYAEQWWPELQRHGSKSFLDYGCNGETSDEFIHGGCPYAKLRHNYFTGPQLDAALGFIKAHRGQVSPVSLDVGADDMIPDVNTNTCAIDEQTWSHDSAKLHDNLTNTILPKLLDALTDSSGTRTGDLVMMNYYDPFINKCPHDRAYMVGLNTMLAATAAQFNIPIVDVYAAFDDAAKPDPKLCDYTWMCSPPHSIHPNSTGYGVITRAFEAKMGY